MRFLKTDTLEFEQIPDSELHLEKNQYAILSHRWGSDEDEVSFEDVLFSAEFSHKQGFHKLKGFCDVAFSENCRYGWVDTCCINKKDSVELGEAINSMYQWYRSSKTCVVYLNDVPQKQLTDSEWFDRGWTLQELIAPDTVSFFDHDWNLIGTKIDLVVDLSRRTRVPEDVLSNAIEPSTCSVAQRMSWAANRTTARVEDRAYSLMGLFDVYMPMIYGERERAVLRLQQHIVQKTKDESMFAWDMDFPDSIKAYSGLYAPSPLAYTRCSDIIKTDGSRGFSESNGELSIWSRILPRSPGTHYAVLNCTHKDFPQKRIFILIGNTSVEGEFVRVRDAMGPSRGLIEFNRITSFKKQHLPVLVDPTKPPVNDAIKEFRLRTLQPPDHHQRQTTILPISQIIKADHLRRNNYIQLLYYQEVAGILRLDPIKSSDTSERFKVHWIVFSFDKDFNPILKLADNRHSQELRSVFDQAMINGIGSLEYKEFIEALKSSLNTWTVADSRQPTKFNIPQLGTDLVWPLGSLTLTIDRRTGLQRQVIKCFGLRISIQLQPCHDPTMIPADNVDESSLALEYNPLSEWAVDITDVRGACSEGKGHDSRERPERLEKKTNWIVRLLHRS